MDDIFISILYIVLLSGLFAIIVGVVIGSLPEHIREYLYRHVYLRFKRKYTAVVKRKKVRRLKYLAMPARRMQSRREATAEYYEVDASVNGQIKKYYCRSLAEHKKLPTNQEITIYVSGKTIVHFEKVI